MSLPLALVPSYVSQNVPIVSLIMNIGVSYHLSLIAWYYLQTSNSSFSAHSGLCTAE